MTFITYNESEKIFHLTNGHISYLFEVEQEGSLAHLYFGKSISSYNGIAKYPRINRSFSPNVAGSTDLLFSRDTVLHEFSTYGSGDFREPALVLKFEDGSMVSEFKYKNYEIINGKPALKGLPSSYVEQEEDAQTLVVSLVDEVKAVELQLIYTVYRNQDVITRSSRMVNHHPSPVHILRLMSSAMDMASEELELIHLDGTWAREREMTRELITPGTKRLDSKRGTSSHQSNPFLALVTPHTTEHQGEVYGYCLVYSGSHEMIVQKDPYEQTRVMLGIQSHLFDWPLAMGESFQSPEVIMTYSDSGLTGMSQNFHKHIQNHIIRGRHKFNERPILVNNWEATYFDFTEDKILTLVDEAAELGIELFVLDDGWFGHRDNDRSSLGDWDVYQEKIPSGIDGLSRMIHAKGMKFGLWFEPEMISADSQLFNENPDWVLHTPGRPLSESRHQYVLDFSREEVRAHIFNKMVALLETCDIDYIKWDMNRHLTEIYSSSLESDQQGTIAHRYVLGLYDFLERLTQRFPDILFESCSGGGGRFDAGMLYYMPQTWTSDNTDAQSRLAIQYGTSLVYPVSSMGAHISAIPNHQTQRVSSLKSRGDVAMMGVFGYELDLTMLTEAEKMIVREQIEWYKKHRKLIQFGQMYRLANTTESNEHAWMFVDASKDEAIVFYIRKETSASEPIRRLKVVGLDPAECYQVNGQTYSGDELMNIGLYMNMNNQGDLASRILNLRKIKL